MVATLDDKVDFDQLLRQVVFEQFSQQKSVFEIWFDRVQHYDKHEKGRLFEQLCKLVLLESYPQVWLLEEIPADLRNQLCLKKGDFGIDLICADQHGFYAVQSKFRKGRLSWRELSTFDALVHRTGPWRKHIVMTTANSVRRIGRRTKLDQSICWKSFCNLSNEFWIRSAKLVGHPLGKAAEPDQAAPAADPAPDLGADLSRLVPKRLTRQELAQLRINYFSGKCPEEDRQTCVDQC